MMCPAISSSYQVDEWNNGWKAIAAVTNGTGYSVNGLSPGTRYYFDVGATNSAGTSWANYQSATTFARLSAPAAPSFTATTASTSQIGLAWRTVNGATSYLIQESKAGGWVTIASLGSNATTYNAFGQNAGTAYSFRVAAVNSAGTTWASPKAATTFHNPGNLGQSNNWSGYIIQPNGLVSEVAGSWVVPATVGTEAGSMVSIWVGIDGAGSHSVEQIGTSWTAAKGWYAWVELFGDTNGQGKGQYYYETPISSFSVHTGDVVSASVKFIGNTATGSEFSFGITDQSTSGSIGSTQGWSNVLTTQYIQPARTTGEWIAEAPSNSSGVVPLANFGTVAFSHAWATAGGVSGPIASFRYYPEFISQTSREGWQRGLPDSTSSITTRHGYRKPSRAASLQASTWFLAPSLTHCISGSAPPISTGVREDISMRRHLPFSANRKPRPKMLPESDEITVHLLRLSDGNHEAAQVLWNNYFERLAGFARRKFQSLPTRDADEEDVALSAMNSFCRGVREHRFPQLNDRSDLWRLLATIAARKVHAQLRKSGAAKRGGGAVRGESVLMSPDGEDAAGIDQVLGREPTPELANMFAEDCERLLAALGDESLRKVALLKLEGHTSEEIAAALGCVTRTVDRKLERIRELWSRELKA